MDARRLTACMAAVGLALGCGSSSESPSRPAVHPSRAERIELVAARVPHPETRHDSGPSIRFETAGPDSGFDFTRNDDIHGQRRILEVNGGGVALFDFDRDGWLDVFMTNGCRLPRRLDDGTTPCALFRNRGAGRFERVTDDSTLVQHGYNHGCAVGDVDGDGFDDLYVTAYGHNALWLNNGDGTFSEVTDQFGVDDPRWSSSAAFADLDGDGHLDLYVVNYVDESDERPRVCENASSSDGLAQCSPAVYEGQSDSLFVSDGAGRFVDVTDSSGLRETRGKGLGVVVSDFDRDGRMDVYVANDGQANLLYANPADAIAARSPIEDSAILSGVALNELGLAQAGMGVASGDADGDGTFDLFLTHFFGDTNTLYANRGELVFDDATRHSGLGPPSRRVLGFGTDFLDADNDGDLDLLTVNGHVDDRRGFAVPEPYAMRPQFFHNHGGGRFDDRSESSGAFFLEEGLGRGLATGDLDRDGRIDAVVSRQLAPSALLWNRTPGPAGAVVLRLVGTTSNRNGIGAVVEVVGADPPQVRVVHGGGSFLSASSQEVHLGAATAEPRLLRVHWPSGAVQEIEAARDDVLLVVEGIPARNDLSKVWNKSR